MDLMTYNDHLRQLLGKYECILAYDTAADYLGLTNGGYRPFAQIYVTRTQDIEDTQQFIIPSFDSVKYMKRDGLLCTTLEQTILDLLRQNGDEQIIVESLASYYEDHNSTFSGLRIPEYLRNRFDKYSSWAVEYYEEG